uniref:Uncharacterized protein K0116D04.33 n=1 Tax=Oryza sativa subsp. indica TaxID=39946 RepID=C8TFC7_ORYSI|nr:hypothetical protein [Oryza sativa Indica Group]BAI39880.1 hypothetical protein [Oryza sativa Indica Group]
MDSPATPVGLSPPLLSLVLRNEPCYTKGFVVDRVHGSGSQKRTAEIFPSKTDGRDRSVHGRTTRDDDDDVSGDVTTGGGSGAQARRRTTARRHERRARARRERRGELTGDQNGGGRSTDGDGVEEEAAATFGLTTTAVFRQSTATAEGRTRTATRRRPRWRPPRATATTGATAAHGWSDGDDGGARSHGARALPTARDEGEGGDGLGGPYKGARRRRRRPTATGDAKESLGFEGERSIRIELESTDFQTILADDSKREKIEEISGNISPQLISPEKERRGRIWKETTAARR